MTAHAEKRPPSSAHRWLSCPGSVGIMPTYPNDPTRASERGDVAHDLLNTAITFGVVPSHKDIDLTYSAMYAYEKIMECYNGYKARGDVQLFTEMTLDIPETGEFGTSDVIFVTPTLIHIIDFKNGYVPVDIKMNAQLLLYLLGAIALYGERKTYRISVIQPNYEHSDGYFRHFDVSHDDLEWFRREVQYAMLHDHLVAGKHCKTSYCPHRGSCEVFLEWSRENLKLAWFPGELSGMSDEQLAEALDQAEVINGWEKMLRGEALRRIVHQDKTVDGFKVVRGRKDRDFANEQTRAKVYQNLRDLGVPEDELYDHVPISVAGVERVVKGIFKSQGRGAWVKGMEHVCGPDMLSPVNHTLSVERTIDGRKPFRPGSEFTPLKEKENAGLPDVL